MNKIENLTVTTQKQETTSSKSGKMLWWMQKGKNAIYIQFVNKACMI
ncbi:MAG: hypothetical protein ACREBI_08410 [Nitrosotalea sp.]